MAGALRPAVLVIAFASLLFALDGYLDGIYPGGPHWSFDAYLGLGWTSYVFASVNAVLAVLIARGSERVLALRIGLAAFFMFERPVSAVALGPKPLESVAVHGLTALVEAVILATTMRVWRLGHSVSETDLSLLALPTIEAPAAAAASVAAPAHIEAPVTTDLPVVVMDPAAEIALPQARRRFAFPRFGRRVRAPASEAVAPAPPAAPLAAVEPPLAAAEPPIEPPRTRTVALSQGRSWTLGLLTLFLAGALVADGAVAGIVPGVTVDVASSAWLVYLFALVMLVVAARAVHGGRFTLRLLLVLALIYFLERAFSPFALRVDDPVSLGLHFLAAFVALALAVATAAALRGAPGRTRPTMAS